MLARALLLLLWLVFGVALSACGTRGGIIGASRREIHVLRRRRAIGFLLVSFLRRPDRGPQIVFVVKIAVETIRCTVRGAIAGDIVEL
jgi:hypothetical protein